MARVKALKKFKSKLRKFRKSFKDYKQQVVQRFARLKQAATIKEVKQSSVVRFKNFMRYAREYKTRLINICRRKHKDLNSPKQASDVKTTYYDTRYVVLFQPLERKLYSPCIPNMDLNSHCAIGEPPFSRKVSDTHEKVYSPSYALSTFATMRDLYEDSKLIDVTLIVAGMRIGAHKLVLSAASDYFRAMFTNDVIEAVSREVTLEDVNPDALKQLVDYCYSGELEINEDSVEVLFSTANMIQLTEVVQQCTSFLVNRLDPSNCIGIKMFSEQHSRTDLHMTAECYTLDNFAEVIKHEEFLNISDIEIKKYLSSENINVPTEEALFDAVMAWINHDFPDRQRHAAQILSSVKLPLLSAKFISEKLTANPLFREDECCHKLLMEAVNYHLVPKKRALMISPRTRARKSTLGTVLAIAGLDCFSGSVSIDEYDPRTNLWAHFGTLPGRRLQFGAVIIDNKLYIVGGRDGLRTLSNVDCYDLSTKTWSVMPNMATGRHGSGVIAMQGPIYAVGGHDGWSYLSTVERWDPSSASWSFVAPMNTQRSTCGVAVLNNRLYAVGGRDGSSCLNSVECYDPHTNKWTMCAPMSKRRGGVGCAVANGYLYAFGGHDAPILNPTVSRFRCGEMYDPERNSWKSIEPMAVGRDAIATCVLGSRILAIGGYDGRACVPVVETYDPQLDHWLPVTQMTMARAGIGIAVLKKNSV